MKINIQFKRSITAGVFFLSCTFFIVAGAWADKNQFIDNGDGTVYDAKTGLTWQQGSSDIAYDWEGALAYVAQLNASGLGQCSGWVLPTRKELKRIVDHHKNFAGPALINSDFFPDTEAAFYWSSSSHKNTLKYAISFANGQQRKMSSANPYYVRAVRGECDPADNDGDGYLPGDGDCNDSDPNINPGAVEICDGYVDNNCDGNIDLTCWDVDNDLDGQTENEGDCDDRDPNNFSGNSEVCDGADNDCDGVADNGLTFDDDGDGFTSLDSCGGSKDDCDDGSGTVYPGAAEICGDLIDQDCSGVDLSCLDVDNDGDGQTENAGDCDDADPANFSGNTEVCDGADNDCDAVADNGLSTDADGDGHYTPASCFLPNDDCDDSAANRFPGNPEDCDGIDNDCNDLVDDGLTQTVSCELPGACVNDTGTLTCIGPGVWDNTCDTLPSATPEVCDDIDNDCDGLTDEGVLLTFYWDGDDDTYGSSSTLLACSPSSGFVSINGDCNDTDPAVNPAAPEVCEDGIDNNCDTQVDEGRAPAADTVELDDGVLYANNIQTPYDAITAGGSGTIKAKTVSFPESLIFDRDVVVYLLGGFDDTFSASSGYTTISAPGVPALIVSSGRVIIDKIILR